MPKKEYSSYQYVDPDNKYTYPNSSVLINKFDIQDVHKAREKEYELVSMRLLELDIFPIKVQSMKDILAIHQYIFQDLYWWAGQYREVNISKSGNNFMAMQAFGSAEIYMNSLLKDYHQNAQTRDDVIRHLALILDNQNYLHPFREGNGRTQREVVRVLALEKGYKAQIKLESDDEIYNLYMDGTVYSDTKKLEQLFDKILENAE
ncbi:Fic/DOC family protein [Lactococcus insecticola]|uniref:protein adenylyltransferase n=1 Tax=Pseudolactococcus insecticola TaxID=2709158 RepID=A0A6A0B7Z7_9LACT|nr:Fic family protein [Lactococcus insecticola]GFH40588.1 Fic family protein [Lactococcus insecticola]